MLYANCHVIWLDVAQFNKINYFNFIWKKNDENLSNSVKQTPNINNLKAPNYIIFYDVTTSQLMDLYYKYSLKLKWNIEFCDSYVKPDVVIVKQRSKSKHKPQRASTSVGGLRTTLQQHYSINSNQYTINEIFYICQFKAVLPTYINDKHNKDLDTYLNKLQCGVIDKMFSDYYHDAIKYNYRQLYGPFNIHPLVVNIDNDKNQHYFYTALYKPIDKEAIFFIEKNVSDSQIMQTFSDYTCRNLKLVYLKAYKNEKQIVKFLLIFTNMPFYEGTCVLFIGLTKYELSNKIIQMRQKSLYPTIITDYGVATLHGDHLFAAFFCQI